MTRLLPSVLFLLLQSGCSNTPVEQPYQPDYARGMALYRGECGSCHDPGESSAPALGDAEEWDVQRLSPPGLLGQHLAMNQPRGSRVTRLSGHDEADVLLYLQQEISSREDAY